MPARLSGNPACPDADRRQRLALQITDMIPGAATLRVSRAHPGHTWPHPHALARSAEGQRIDLTRTLSRTAARWVMRVYPETDWTRPHTLDLATATLMRADRPMTRRGR
jgi:hypothetical protein